MVYHAILLRDLDTLQPRREALRDVLLPEPLGADAGGIAFHRDRPATQVRQDHRRHRLVIRRDLALGDPVFGEEHLLWVRNHACSLTTSCGSLSNRTPISLG